MMVKRRETIQSEKPNEMVEVFSQRKYYENSMIPFDTLPTKEQKRVLSKPMYHGTDIKNIDTICKDGLKRGDACHVGDISLHDPLIGSDRIYDCIGNVSFAIDRKDAIFFASAHGRDPRASGGQVIFEVDPRKLNVDDMFFRDIFGKKNKEVKYVRDVPVEAITRIFVRKFDWSDGLDVTEKYCHCPCKDENNKPVDVCDDGDDEK